MAEKERSYPEYYERLRGLMDGLRQEIPGVITGFGRLHKGAITEGAH